MEVKQMIYITGDTHGDFKRITSFCNNYKTSIDDVLIILGDAGINYFGYPKDNIKKDYINMLPITLFCIHGNHEKRPATIETYVEKNWNGGQVYIEEEYPRIIFAKDGETYNLQGIKAIAIGGAYSIDKKIRLAFGDGWWEDEQPSNKIKSYVEQQLEKNQWDVDVVLSHTVPLKYEPVEVFISGFEQSLVDKSTELWLGKIEEQLNYKKWYAGHYHTTKKIDRLEIMFENYDKLKI
jgi:DNA repair exonuclease SbcCD nuclease subunit